MSGRRVVGVDLTATPRRSSAAAFVAGSRASVEGLRGDDEIFRRIAEFGAELVAIDAPLSWPRSGRGLRECDRAVRRLGVGILPPVLGPMRLLTSRAVALSGELRSAEIEAVEVYPRAVQRLMGWVGRGEKPGPETLRRLLRAFQVSVEVEADEHAIDALTCAWVAVLRLRGEAVELGDPEEGTIVLPRVCLTP
ncbi:MAG: DUF429 domain-containing protein [Candidatus Caldarchaeales archaeon]